MLPRRPLSLILFVVFLSSLLLVRYQTSMWQPMLGFQEKIFQLSSGKPTHLDFGFVTSTYIVSLPHRQDRQEDMTTLMTKLGVTNWSFFDGVFSNTSSVRNLMRHVAVERVEADFGEKDLVDLPFSWPEETEELFVSRQKEDAGTIPLAGAELWHSQLLEDTTPIPPMLSAEQDFQLQKHTYDVPQWRQLTLQRVAIYDSHMKLIRRIVDDNASSHLNLTRAPGRVQDNISLILEDDIDIEVDIERRMEPLIPLLPYDWDILFLGFCWSPEGTHTPLESEYITPKKALLHPSYQPRCTHAYALSPVGAVRVLRYLRYLPFAYSRAIDLALEWLIWTKKIKGYTVVPPPIIQTKVWKSDAINVDHGHWDENLDNGVLGLKGNEV